METAEVKWESINKLINRPVYRNAKEIISTLRERGLNPDIALTMPASTYGALKKDDSDIFINDINNLGVDFIITVTWLQACGLDINLAYGWAIIGDAYKVENLELYKVIEGGIPIVTMSQQLRKSKSWSLALSIVENDIDPELISSLIG